MTTNLSQFTKLGQTIQFRSGASALAPNDLIEIGGPGNEAYPVKTIDYAITNWPVLLYEYQFGAKSMSGSVRQSAVRDPLGNIYILSLNSSGNLVASKFSMMGALITTVILDAGTSNAFTAKIMQLVNGNFVAVYARTAGSLRFVIFDSSINILASTLIDPEYQVSDVVHHSAIALAGGGFAIAYQTAVGTAINLQTFSNSGANTLGSTNIQTLSSTAAKLNLKLGQLPNGNLVVVMRGTMTPAGTTFVIVTTAGVGVVANTVINSTSTAGLVELDILQTGYFAVAVQTGTNIICAVYSQAGVVQGTPYSAADTLNTLTYIQYSLINDGAKFWLTFIGSVNAGVNIVQIPTAGTNYQLTTALGSSIISSSSFSLDAAIVNGLLAVLVCSIATGGQYWMTVGLPDTSLNIGIPYVRTPPSLFGTLASTTGGYWPRIMDLGDWCVAAIYDRQNTTGVMLGILRFETSRVIGVNQSTVAAASPGSLITVNTGPGSYICNTLIGTSGVQFSQGGRAPFGNIGTIYNNGISMGGIPAIPGTAEPEISSALTGIFGSGQYNSYATPGVYSWTVPAGVTAIRTRVVGGGRGAGTSPNNGTISSFGTLISATGGTASPGTGTGGQLQATGGTGGTGFAGTNGGAGGGGAAGSILGNGGNGGAGSSAYNGGGGAVGGYSGEDASSWDGAGSGSAGPGNGGNGGANTDGYSAVPGENGKNPSSFSMRFPHEKFGGGGGGTGQIVGRSGVGVAGGGAVGGGGGGCTGSLGAGSLAGSGGIGGGGGGTNQGGFPGSGGIGAGGGGKTATGAGAGVNGGNGGGFAIGIFYVIPGTVYTVTVGAGGAATATGGSGGNGLVVVEF